MLTSREQTEVWKFKSDLCMDISGCHFHHPSPTPELLPSKSLFHSLPFPYRQRSPAVSRNCFSLLVPHTGCKRAGWATGLTFSFSTLWKSWVAKVSFSKILESFPSKVWLWLEISHKTVARVNIIPAITFCTISHESSQWFSTATGNNDSQLE